MIQEITEQFTRNLSIQSSLIGRDQMTIVLSIILEQIQFLGLR